MEITKRREIFQVGPGEFDKIGINKITRSGYERAKVTVVMVPGANSDFLTSFEGMATYLAQRGVSVWGIDLRHSFVPDNADSAPYCYENNCDFMKDWNTEMHLSDINTVVKMAEFCAGGGVFMIGFGLGAYFAYRYAEKHPELRGVVPMDITYSIDPVHKDIIRKAAEEVKVKKEKMNAGIYFEDVLAEKYMASLAAQKPDAMSPIIPNLMNKQAYLYALTATYNLPGNIIPDWRYAQGDLKGLRYTDYDFILAKTFKFSSFQSIIPTVELYDQLAETPVIPDIKSPILYVGAEFGFGEHGLCTPEKIREANKDVSTELVMDYGHADLLWGKNARYDVWKGVCKWMREHIK